MRAAGKAESTIRNALVVLRAIYRLAQSRGHVSSSPLDGLDPAEKPKNNYKPGRVLDENNLAALVRHAPAAYQAPVVLCAYTGLRLSELLGLRWEDIDFVGRELRVSGQLSYAKRGRPARVIPAKR